jgi:tRNA pseudouridine55 synthase
MRRRLDGVLLLDKPVGLGSNAALQTVKRLFQAEKAGHAGTLDPLASGLLPILFGEATKFSQLALDADKEYLATARLGITTTTADAEGEVLERRPVEVLESAIEPALARLRGPIDQVPPMYSALKRAGQPLYALARQGRSVERAARRVQIYEFEMLRFAGESLDLRIRCSKGTYVRTLVEDLGRALGCGAHLASLRRTAAGDFRVADAVTFEKLQQAAQPERDCLLLPMERLLAGLPRVDLTGPLADRFAQGQAIALEQALPGRCSVYRAQGGLLGIGDTGPLGELRPRRLVAHPPESTQPAEKHQKNL